MKGLNYRPPFDTSGEFPDWLNALRNQSGAYIIRSRRTRQILYVGESHTGNLAKTLNATSTRGATIPNGSTTPTTGVTWK